VLLLNQFKKEKKEVMKKFTHSELESMGVLMKLNFTLDKDHKRLLKKCYYTFTMVTAGKYLVAVHSKKTIIDKMMPKPVEIVLEELLKIQEHGQKELELDFVTLNVNFLVHLLNAHFVAK